MLFSSYDRVKFLANINFKYIIFKQCIDHKIKYILSIVYYSCDIKPHNYTYNFTKLL